jgi:hypothetical protein
MLGSAGLPFVAIQIRRRQGGLEMHRQTLDERSEWELKLKKPLAPMLADSPELQEHLQRDAAAAIDLTSRDAEFAAEYDQHVEVHRKMRVSREDFILSRRIEEGLEPLCQATVERAAARYR